MTATPNAPSASPRAGAVGPDHGAAVLDVHGLTIRLEDAGSAEIALVQRQLPGVQPAPVAGSPEVVVRFVRSVAPQGTVHRFGSDLVDDDGIVLVRRGRGRPARARLRLDRDPVEVVCERHGREVPGLVTAIRMAALHRGFLPLHAVAFRHRGVGFVATGWSGSGKTAVLLAMLAAGAVPVAAEWVLVDPDGRELLGIPQPVRIKPSHTRRWPDLTASTRATMTASRRVLAAVRPALRRIATLNAALEGALHVDVSFTRLASEVGTRPDAPSAPFDVVLLLDDADVPTTRVERVGAEHAIERIAVGLEHDLDDWRDARRMLRYAWARPVPDPLGIDAADRVHRELLARHLATRPAFAVYHRQPTPFHALREAAEQAIA
ncbi:MAG TPA: hypothetical protein VMQ81_08100 [Acidimicrobiia bacterium]|nr:hypothetical protein [Acidimicrobiia bacterium]